MQKRLGILGIFLIVIMFVFSSGFVFADDDSIIFTNDFESNNVGWIIQDPIIDEKFMTISVLNNWEDRMDCQTNDPWYSSTQYEGVFIFAFFTNEPFDQRIVVDHFVVDKLFERGEKDTEQFLKEYNQIKNDLKDELDYFIKPAYPDNVNDFYVKKFQGDFLKGSKIDLNIDLENIKNYSKAYVYFLDHCGYWSEFNSIKQFNKESIFDSSKSSVAKIEYKFNLKNVFKDKLTSSKELSSIKLTSKTEDNKIKLDSNVTDNVNIYYTLDDFNLEKHFKSKFVEFNYNKEKINTYLKSNSWNINQFGVNFIVTKYTAPVSLSSGQKLNAIAVNYDNFTLSNYLEGITLSSSPSNSQSSSLNNFSINFKEDKKTNDVICEKETKICYAKINQNINLDLIANKVNDGNVYFAINYLTKDFTEINFNNPKSTLLSSNEIKLGNKLRFYNSNNKEFKMNLSQNNEGSFVLAAGQTYTNVDYLFFIFLHDENFEDLVKYKILQKIVNDAYCTTFNCKIPDWMPYNILTPVYQDPVCEQIIKDDGKVEKESCKPRDDPKLEFSCDVYVSNLRKNLNIFDLNQKHTEGKIYGDILTSQMNNITINPNNQSKFNNVVLDVSKGYKFTDEETVQFISILAQESTFGTNVEGGLNEFGFAQIHYDAWFWDSTKISNGKNQLKSYFEIILDNKDNLSDENIKNINTTDALYDYVNQTIVGYRNYKSPDNLNKMNYATTVFGGAIYLYNRDQILNNGNNFPRASFSTYDDKDSIDALFASASKYVTPKTGFNIKATMIADGLITHDNALKTIYKMAYYLSYKKYICENENNFFNITLNKSVSNTTSTSTNVDLSGVLPVKKNITDEQIKNELLGKTEYQNYCATFAREAGNYIFNYSPPLQSNDAWYFGNSNQVILKVNNETEINPNNLVPGSILGIKIGNKDFYDTKEDGRLEDLPYTHVALYVGDFNGQRNVVFDGGWTNNNVKSFYKTFDQYFNDHPTYDLKEVILPKGSVTDEQKAYLSECIKSKNKFCNYYT